MERKILIGLITSTEYLRQIENEWQNNFIESSTARLISGWCWEYFKKYRKAPMRDIELIYIEKLKSGLDSSLAKEIEEEILPELSNEYENDGTNISYLIEKTNEYFNERRVIIHNEELNYLISKNKIDDALNKAQNFKIVAEKNENEIDLSSEEVLNKIESAFDTTYQNVIKFPGALGEFWNEQLIRGGFVSILSPEKRGKSFWLLEFMMRAYQQGRNVAFFQAGDMTENQFLMRVCIYLAKKSNIEKYCGVQYVPVQDCIKNQTDNCDKKIRECNFGVFNYDENRIRKHITKQELVNAYRNNLDYRPCYNCVEWSRNKWGTIWLHEIDIKHALTSKEAKRLIQRFFIRTKRKIKLSTHVNGTLSIKKIKSILNKWKENGFVPDLILIDYADLLECDKKMEFRHQQNQIWRDLRGLSQEDDCLVVAPTQSDAGSYSKDRLELENFSEDKRKYGHVTAMYGLNQDKMGREKELGIMRINKIVIREGDFHPTQEVHVLHRLQIGRPFLGSYF